MARKSKKKVANPPQAGYGDRLARGSGSASFGSMSHIDQKKWDDIFGPTKPIKRKTVKTF